MKRALLLLMLAAPAWAADYTINLTTNARQEAALSQLAADAGVTNAEYLRSALIEKVRADVLNYRRARLCADFGQWEALTAAQRSAVCAACGTQPADCPN